MGIFSSKKTNNSDQEEDVINLDKEKELKEKKVKEEKEQSSEKNKSMKDLYNETDLKTDKKNLNSRIAYRVLVKPAVTEKASDLGSLNQYVFIVNVDANKIDVARAIFEVYGVKPLSVNIIKMKGKSVTRGRIKGRRKDFKKAIVTLKKGDSISVYEGV